MHLRRGDAAGAVALLEGALQCATPNTSSDERLRIMNDHANALVQQQEHETALKRYQELHRLGLDYARYALNLHHPSSSCFQLPVCCQSAKDFTLHKLAATHGWKLLGAQTATSALACQTPLQSDRFQNRQFRKL